MEIYYQLLVYYNILLSTYVSSDYNIVIVKNLPKHKANKLDFQVESITWQQKTTFYLG